MLQFANLCTENSELSRQNFAVQRLANCHNDSLVFFKVKPLPFPYLTDPHKVHVVYAISVSITNLSVRMIVSLSVCKSIQFRPRIKS